MMWSRISFISLIPGWVDEGFKWNFLSPNSQVVNAQLMARACWVPSSPKSRALSHSFNQLPWKLGVCMGGPGQNVHLQKLPGWVWNSISFTDGHGKFCAKVVGFQLEALLNEQNVLLSLSASGEGLCYNYRFCGCYQWCMSKRVRRRERWGSERSISEDVKEWNEGISERCLPPTNILCYAQLCHSVLHCEKSFKPL